MMTNTSLNNSGHSADRDGKMPDNEKALTQELEDVDTGVVYPTNERRRASPEEKKLLRKLDWMILPLLWVIYWLNYLDRNAITVARLDDMERELNLTSTQYQTCVSILFVGYILGQIPCSKTAQKRIKPRKSR